MWYGACLPLCLQLPYRLILVIRRFGSGGELGSAFPIRCWVSGSSQSGAHILTNLSFQFPIVCVSDVQKSRCQLGCHAHRFLGSGLRSLTNVNIIPLTLASELTALVAFVIYMVPRSGG